MMEIVKNILLSDNVVEKIRNNLNELLKVIPEISSMIHFEHKHPHHHLDVWEHTLCALSYSPNDFDIRLALLLHDIGKPKSYQEKEGFRHFKGHAEESSKIANNILKRLGFNEKYIQYICDIVRLHDTPLTEKNIKENPFLSKKIFEVQKCDTMAHNPVYNKKRIDYLQNIEQLLKKQDKNNINLIMLKNSKIVKGK